jgi:hypothetical protein
MEDSAGEEGVLTALDQSAVQLMYELDRRRMSEAPRGAVRPSLLCYPAGSLIP